MIHLGDFVVQLPADVRGVEGTFRDRVREILQSSNDARR